MGTPFTAMRLGLFIQIEDPKMWLVIGGAIAAARQQRAQLVVYAGASEASHAQLDKQTIESCYNFSSRAHNGAILSFGSEKLLRYGQDLWTQGFPVMLVGRRAGAVPFTANNHQETMRESVRMLVEKGHQQIAYLAGPLTNLSSAEKQAGYMQGVAQNGLNFDPALVIPGDYTEHTAKENMAAALKAGLNFTALIASNDLGAIGAMDALREHGLAPGADIEVLGFDNIPQSHWSRPPLSTYDPHYYQMGHKACTELVSCVSRRNYIVSSTVPAVFIPRETTWETGVVDELEHPLNSLWVENKFVYVAQQGILRTNEKAVALLEELNTHLAAPESFLQVFRELLLEAELLGLSPGCLFPALHECLRLAGGRKSAGERVLGMLREACALQTSMLFDEQRRTTDRATRYGIASFELRQLSLAHAREDTVLACLRRTLTALEVRRAGVFLYDRPARIGLEIGGRGRWMDLTRAEGAGELHLERFDLSVFEDAPEVVLYVPLIENDELIGLMLLDGTNEFLTHYALLSRQFSSALRAAHLQRELSRANAELVETSRLAGLAEMATGVLHNIGNALNGVNTNCSLMEERLHKSHTPAVQRLAELLRKHEGDLATFLTADPKGRQVPSFLTQLGEQLTLEQRNLTADLGELRAMVEHINEIVAAQQSYAQISGIVEEVQPAELLEFALRLGEASLTRHGVRVDRAYEDVSNVRIQRQKAVQILVNLIRNAKESMDLARRDTKVMSLAISRSRPGFIAIAVRDNGTGIPRENLPRIFNFGFTTKPGGHGFGLHNGALAAREMGGSLTANSDGAGAGAVFTLELPMAHPA